jgi:hypothetical protein
MLVVINMRILATILILTLLGSGKVIGQSLSPKNLIENGKFAVLVGYNYNKGHWGELGIVRGYRVNYEHDPSMPALEMLYPYASLSTEFLVDDKFVICPKFGYHFVLAMVDLGINLLDYTNFNEHRFGIRPEIGLSLGGMIGGYYGYNLTTNKLFNVSNHNFGIKIIFGSGLFIDGKWREKHKRN